ncbi:MAG: hypothetical protein QOH35_996 [Acidobacteriaceae bacterium]|jgi:hypothetical protein|nr:hypothetical protein [Acidobacteriaceae bacterium]
MINKRGVVDFVESASPVCPRNSETLTANGYGVTPKAPGALLYPTLTVPTVPK